jgi:hypothetical protein
MRFYDENGMILRPVSNGSPVIAISIEPDTPLTVFGATIPENTSYMQVDILGAGNVEYDLDLQVCIVVDEELKTATLTDGTVKFTEITANDIITMPYLSTVDVKIPIKSYIDYKTENVKGAPTTYLTPEAFGAVGNGKANDIEAITACLAKAAETKQTVLMAQKYFVSAPIIINGDGFNIYINDIIYNGTDSAVAIYGQQNTIKIHSISSGGNGLILVGDGKKSTSHNNLEVNTIIAAAHGIIFESVKKEIYQNSVHFDYIQAGGGGYYGISYVQKNPTHYGGVLINIGENNFYGGDITNCSFAVYNAGSGSRYINIHTLNTVVHGFYIVGPCNIINPRWNEAHRIGMFPFLKFACGVAESGGVKIENNTPI